MFTGLVEECGSLRSITNDHEGAELEIQAKEILEDLKIGDSIAVNGVCLTVTAIDRDNSCWRAHAVQETLNKTTLGTLSPGTSLNLERSLLPHSRMGGHIVQGHIDGTATLTEKTQLHDDSYFFTFTLPDALQRYTIQKGSIALDGISLTIAELHPHGVSIAVIPHTATHTNLGQLSVGSPVNIEVDIIAKYVERLTTAATQTLKGAS